MLNNYLHEVEEICRQWAAGYITHTEKLYQIMQIIWNISINTETE